MGAAGARLSDEPRVTERRATSAHLQHVGELAGPVPTGSAPGKEIHDLLEALILQSSDSAAHVPPHLSPPHLKVPRASPPHLMPREPRLKYKATTLRKTRQRWGASAGSVEYHRHPGVSSQQRPQVLFRSSSVQVSD